MLGFGIPFGQSSRWLARLTCAASNENLLGLQRCRASADTPPKMVRLNPPIFIVLNKAPTDDRVSDLAPMPRGAIVFLVIVVTLTISAAVSGKLSARTPVTPANPAPAWTCWSTDANYCGKQ
jgi:hypothetical protein